MRSLFALLLFLPLLMPCVGCGPSRPNAIENPPVDETDPDVAGGALDADTGPAPKSESAP